MTAVMERTDREQELLHAAERLGESYQTWLHDTPDDLPPTADLEEAAEDFLIVCDGDIPASCRELVGRAAAFGELWRCYTRGDDGHRRPGHMPTATLLNAFQAIIDSAKGARTYRPKRPEPVSVLLEQKVSHSQIARYIYGQDGVGPFLGPREEVLVDRILQEAKEPGSVIPEDWVHPSEREAERKSIEEQRKRIAAAAAERHKPSDEDPVAMLKEGAYASQVASVCGLTPEEVYEIASANGIVPNTKPNLSAERSLYDAEPSEERLAGANPLGRSGTESESREQESEQEPSTPLNEDESGTDHQDIRNWTAEELTDLVVGVLEENPEAGAPEIARIIKDDGGPKIHGNKVAAILRRAKE